MPDLEPVLNSVIATLLSRWDPHRCRFQGHDDPLGDPAFLDSRGTVRVFIDETEPDDVALAARVVHGICHRRQNNSHSQMWAADMDRAAKRAEEAGWADVAEAIRYEVERQRGPDARLHRVALHMARLQRRVPKWGLPVLLGLARSRAVMDRRDAVELDDPRLPGLIDHYRRQIGS